MSDLDDLPDDTVSEAAPRYSRRLTDKLLVAFHHACDQREFEVAQQLLLMLETLVTRPPAPGVDRRRGIQGLVAAHERLWQLRHPDP